MKCKACVELKQLNHFLLPMSGSTPSITFDVEKDDFICRQHKAYKKDAQHCIRLQRKWIK
jgi:hypothetical protein